MGREEEEEEEAGGWGGQEVGVGSRTPVREGMIEEEEEGKRK